MRVALGCLLMIPLSAWAAGPTKPVDLTMSWVITVDKDGKLGAMTPTEDKNKGLYQRLEAGIRKYWVFKPGKVNGKPEASQTTLTVHSTLEPVDSYYRVRVRDASTGPRADTMVAPKYPDDARMAQRGGGVLVEVRYDANGKVTAAKKIAGGEPRPGPDIERAAVIALKQWTFKPETVGGHGIAGTAIVPLCFAAVPAKEKACRWETASTKAPLDANRPVAMRPAVHLDTDPTKQDL